MISTARKILFAAIAGYIFLSVSPVMSQSGWTRLPSDSAYSEPYFLNKDIGFLIHNMEPNYGNPGPLGWELWRTTDGGEHWDTVNAFDYHRFRIAQVYFSDFDHGYLVASATYGQTSRSTIYESNDTGIHWRSICTDTINYTLDTSFQYTSVYATKGALFAAGEGRMYGLFNNYFSFLLRSNDDGKNWDTILKAETFRRDGGNRTAHIFGNKDETVFVEFYDPFFSRKLLFCSTDDGNTWIEDSLFGRWLLGSTGIYCIPHTNELLQVFADTTDTYSVGDSCLIQHSSDLGKTWETYATLPCGMWISGNDCELFVCDAYCSCEDPHFYLPPDSNQVGLYRSVDHGKTWSLMKGPSFFEYDDEPKRRNFCVLNDGTIYANAYSEILSTDGRLSLWRFDPDSSTTYSSLHFFSDRIINDSINVTIHLPIFFHHLGVMNDVDMVMHYPSSGSLKYINGVAYNGKSIDVSGTQSPSRAQLHFAATDLNAAPDSLIGYVNFLWTPFEYDCDHIIFDSIQTMEGPCSGMPQPFQGIIGSFKSCGASSVAEKGKNSLPPDFSIYPNPAKNKVEISLTSGMGTFRYELFDALGISQKSGITSGSSFKIDVSNLSEGNYYLRVEGIGGIPITKRVVIK